MTIRTWMAAGFALVLAACGSDDSGGGNDAVGRMSLAVTDSPVDHAEAVVVTFTGIELLDDGDQVVQSFDLVPPRQIDLLQLQGHNSAFLIEDRELPVGVYRQVRLIVDTPNANCNSLSAPFASYVRVDGTDYPLVVPSGGSSGLKVMGPITVAAGNSADYTVDFDLRKSLAERGATDCYNLKPVLRVVDNATVGTLAGTVDGQLLQDAACTSDPLTGEGAAVYVYTGAGRAPDDVDGAGDEPLTTALLAPDGSGGFTYEVGFLLAGTYTAALTCQAGDDETGHEDPIAFGPPADVTIQSDMTTTLDFTALP